jgi:hypothetical protein
MVMAGTVSHQSRMRERQPGDDTRDEFRPNDLSRWLSMAVRQMHRIEKNLENLAEKDVLDD